MMKFFCTLLFLVVAANAFPPQIKFSESFMRVKSMRQRFGGRIVGGEEVEPNSIPFQISFQTTGGLHFCGASVMDKDTIITAAHCCDSFFPWEVQVVAGEHDLFSTSGDEQKIAVSDITYHEMFETHGTNYDVCLLKLKSSLDLNEKVKPVALPEKDQEFTGDAVVSGWGTIYSDGPSSPLLRSVTVQIVSDEDCSDAYPGSTDETMICAAAAGKDSCQGDSGGPLAQDGTLVGIVSWGRGCAFPGYPGVYGKVSQFIDWIVEHK
ncbi:trypsin-1 [Lepeophtheirus salmonis]|uniref:trypsin-1 n=1 Tax=Lepeophtheirus salmonis TaxID=72036 RepID=UPI001AE4E254|nr:trypsin-1-like [Lepeophtheirus salmonis]